MEALESLYNAIKACFANQGAEDCGQESIWDIEKFSVQEGKAKFGSSRRIKSLSLTERHRLLGSTWQPSSLQNSTHLKVYSRDAEEQDPSL